MFDPNALLLLAALAAPLDTSAHVPTANDSVLASVISPLVKPGDLVVVRSGHDATRGAVSMVDPFGVRLKIDAESIWSQPRTESIGWSQIQRIDHHTGAAGDAAKFGAATGCLLGLGLVASAIAYAGAYDNGPGTGGILFSFVVGGVAGGCVGGLAGGLVGSLLPAWKTIYERR